MYYKFILKKLIRDLNEIVNYDIRSRPPELNLENLKKIPVDLDLKVHSDESGYTLIADSLPGFMVFSPDSQSIADRIKDALFVYFDVPHYYNKRISAKDFVVQDKNGDVVSVGSEGLGNKIFKTEEKVRYIGK